MDVKVHIYDLHSTHSDLQFSPYHRYVCYRVSACNSYILLIAPLLFCMDTAMIRQIFVCNCFQFFFDQCLTYNLRFTTLWYNTECPRAQVISTISRGIRNSNFKESEANHDKMTQKTMHSCLKKMSTTGSTFLLLDPRSGDSEWSSGWERCYAETGL